MTKIHKRICEKLDKKEPISDDEWKLDSYQADQTSKLENNLSKLNDKDAISKIEYCSSEISILNEISLQNYVMTHAKTCENHIGTCKNLSSKLWLDLYQQGIYCGLMFVARPCAYPSRYPNHVVVIFAVKVKNKNVEYYVADPRNLQSSFNLAFLLQNGKHYFNGKLENTLTIVDYNEAWKNYVTIARDCKIIPSCNFYNPLDFLLIPLDAYVKWLGSIQPFSFFKHIKPAPISIATDPNDCLHIRNELGEYVGKVGPKTLAKFKKEVEEKIKNN